MTAVVNIMTVCCGNSDNDSTTRVSMSAAFCSRKKKNTEHAIKKNNEQKEKNKKVSKSKHNSQVRKRKIKEEKRRKTKKGHKITK